MSKASKKSNVSKPSYVDESLFGKILKQQTWKLFNSLLLSNHSSSSVFNSEHLGLLLSYIPVANLTVILQRQICLNLIIGNTKKNGETGGVVTLTKDQLRDIREKTVKGLKSEAIVINQNELERMKAATKI